MYSKRMLKLIRHFMLLKNKAKINKCMYIVIVYTLDLTDCKHMRVCSVLEHVLAAALICNLL